MEEIPLLVILQQVQTQKIFKTWQTSVWVFSENLKTFPSEDSFYYISEPRELWKHEMLPTKLQSLFPWPLLHSAAGTVLLSQLHHTLETPARNSLSPGPGVISSARALGMPSTGQDEPAQGQKTLQTLQQWWNFTAPRFAMQKRLSCSHNRLCSFLKHFIYDVLYNQPDIYFITTFSTKQKKDMVNSIPQMSRYEYIKILS